MESFITYTLIALIMLAIGYFAGQKTARLTQQNSHKDSEREIAEAQVKIDLLTNQLTEAAEKHQKELDQIKSDHDQHLTRLRSERNKISNDKEELSGLLSRRNTELEHLKEKNKLQKTEVEQLQKKFEKEFENLANKILEKKSEKFTTLNKTNLENILSPLQDKIKDFQNKVEKNQSDAVKRHAALGEQLKHLNEQNLKISREAHNLTRALKGESKTQGNWGEKILARVLEKSGLQEGREYFSQQAFTNDQGRKVYPDVVIHLPNDKRMIIDAKVSLTAYEKYVNTEDRNSKKAYLKQHIHSLKNHIKSLNAKAYEDLLKGASPDFVLMFIPIEPALYKAQDEDPSFFYTAFQKNILLVSPTTLLATLRTVDALWSNEKQQQNAQKIAHHATSLYHKFQGLLKGLDTVGRRIDSTKTAYSDAMKKLTGQQNLIKDIDQLEQLGISPKEKISNKWLKTAHSIQDKNKDA